MMSFELNRVDNSNFKTHPPALATPLMLTAFSNASCHPSQESRPGGTAFCRCLQQKFIYIGFGLYLWEKTGITPHQRLQHLQVLYDFLSL